MKGGTVSEDIKRIKIETMIADSMTELAIEFRKNESITLEDLEDMAQAKAMRIVGELNK
jgi:hypothetical protein